MRFPLAVVTLLTLPLGAAAQDRGRAAQDNCDPYYVHRTHPRLTTPQWVGEDGVEAVVVLAIDDMRGPDRWEAYLRPILNRLKQVDGRAAVSIMTCQIDPQHPHLQTWLKEGVSLETHTYDHPCPLLARGDFARAKATYDRCVDLLASVPHSKPVAFRTPCCDSLNTPSPRIFAEIFNKTTPGGNFLGIDSSVFNVFTSDDPELPRHLVLDGDGREKFRKYLPADRTFVNTIENYPYPYVIGNLCWQFPCVTPSDWSAQHYHKPNNPVTIRDWQAAIDCTVLKKGVFCLVFHPHGWIRNDQVVELIDYATAKHGKKVKFLTFREAQERLDKNFLKGRPLRDPKTGADNGVRLVDRNGDGLLEAVTVQVADQAPPKPASPLPPGARVREGGKDHGLRFIDLDEDGHDDVVFSNEKEYGIYLYSARDKGWTRKVMAGKAGDPGALPPISRDGTNNGFFAHSRHLWWQNEHTALSKDLVERRSFNDLLKDVEPEAKSPEAALRSLRTRPGFVVEQVAAEPLVQDPVAFAFGPDGKLWVVEMGDYPLGTDGKGTFGGRVKFLEDLDGDGKYDKATVFLDNLGYPSGIMPWRKGILVSCAPDVFYAEDADGDGKAEVKKVLYSGFLEGNQQHRVNGFEWGLDNWVYGANGDSGGRVTAKQSGKNVFINGRDFRLKPDEGLIDAQTGQTQFGRHRDDWGNWFGNNNSNPMYHFVLADHYQRRNPHYAAPETRVNVSVPPGASPVYPQSRTLPRFNDLHTANHFTSACGTIVYRDDLFGPAYAGNAFVSEPVHNLIHREVVTAQGVTFTSRRAADEQKSEFLASSDNWFRPTMIQTGPDGALWVADMYRHVIEHPQWIPRDWQKRLDLRAGHDKGRIYRIYPVGSNPRAIPRLDRLDAAGLVAALDSPSGWQRDTAQMMLVWRQDKAAVPLLETMAGAATRPQARLHALCTLDGLNDLKPAVLLRALADTHHGVRRHAVRLCEGRFGAAPQLGDALARLVTDDDAQVRLQLAYTLGEWDDPRAGQLLGQLALRDGGDRFHTAAVLSSVHKKNLDGVLLTVLRGARGASLTEPLLRLALSFGEAGTLNRLLTHVARADNGRHAGWQFAALAGLLDALDQRDTTLAELYQEGDEERKAIVKRLDGLFAAARAAAAAEGSPERLAALRLLGRGMDHQAEDLQSLAGLLVPQTPDAVQAAAVASLGRLRGGPVAGVLLRGWKGYTPTLRSQVLDVLLRREEWVKALLDGVEKHQILPLDIDAARRQRLVLHRTAGLRDRAAKLFAEAVAPDRQKVLDAYRSAASLPGDAVRGKELFAKHCAACHQFGGVGNAVGPDLASLGDKSPEALLVALLDPNRAVEARYLNYAAQAKNGLAYAGVLTRETGTSVTLTGPDGKAQVLLRTELEELASTGKSAMPEGLEKELPPQAVADVIAHLRGAAPVLKPKSFPGHKPALIRPEPDGSLHLLGVHATVYGSTVAYEVLRDRLTTWGSEDDHATWELDATRPGKYAVWLEYACNDRSAGNTFLLQAGDQRLTGKVEATRGSDYRQTQAGTVTLTAGKQTLTVRPAGKISGSLFDLRAVKLVPIRGN